MLSDYVELGVDRLLDDAADIIDTKGFAVGVTISPDTGAVDMIGALMTAAGMRPKQITGLDDLESCVGERQAIRLRAAVAVLDGSLDDNAAVYNDASTAAQVTSHLRDLASLLRRTIH